MPLADPVLPLRLPSVVKVSPRNPNRVLVARPENRYVDYFIIHFIIPINVSLNISPVVNVVSC
ncbi:MAG: hypothetical protein KME15_01125 [Drouetiella hepatica Uher 2000/2452]|uniref:Uncharacterized protein n=1 Tax=Drouetiella hepatica Uher 2000/2452 TaxID=904376 RepID=A0A951Q6Y2_9CYAN|nr:hypothetical protein [Drouetiella hepatica Uher 2000/2452]